MTTEDIHAGLSPYELFDLAYTIRAAVTADVTLFMTALCAYLAVAYIAGTRLTKFQIVSITAVYSSFSIFTIAATTAMLHFVVVASNFGGQAYHAVAFAISLLMFIAWLLSVYVMFKFSGRGDL